MSVCWSCSVKLNRKTFDWWGLKSGGRHRGFMGKHVGNLEKQWRLPIALMWVGYVCVCGGGGSFVSQWHAGCWLTLCWLGADSIRPPAWPAWPHAKAPCLFTRSVVSGRPHPFILSTALPFYCWILLLSHAGSETQAIPAAPLLCRFQSEDVLQLNGWRAPARGGGLMRNTNSPIEK